MKNFITSIALNIIIAIIFIYSANAQPITGVKNIPGDYATIKESITALNVNGAGAGGVTFNIAANHTESNADSLKLTATGTIDNPIVFQKNPSTTGANPLITRTDAGVLSTSTISGNGDAIITFEGVDYVTFKNIDLTASSDGIEFGYYIRKADGTNGCKNINIKNCTITLNKGTNNRYSFGILISNNIITSSVSSSNGVAVTTTGGRHENIAVTGNTIQNSFCGIGQTGYNHTVSPYEFYDQNITIGSEGEGNTLQNFGGSSIAGTVFGIYTTYGNNVVISHNNLDNMASGGSGFVSFASGIMLTTAKGTNITVSYNTISLTSLSGNTRYMYCIYGNSGDATSTINIHHNTFENCSHSSTGAFSAITNGVSSITLNVYSNTVQNNTILSTVSPSIFSLGSPANLNIYDNTISGLTIGAATGTSNIINVTSPANMNIYGNTIGNITKTEGIGGGIVAINGGTGTTKNIYGNRIDGIITGNTSTTTVYGINIAGGIATRIYNNIICGINSGYSGANDAIRGISISSTTASSTIGVYYNTIYLNAISAAADFWSSCIYHTQNTTVTTAALDMRNNILVNLSTPTGTGKTVVFRRSASTDLNNIAISDNNCFYAGTPGANKVIFYDGTNSDETIEAYKIRVAPRDIVSFTESPPFVNISSQPYNFHLNANPSLCKNGALPINEPIIITDDYDNNPRSITLPTVGAYEYIGGIPVPLEPLLISPENNSTGNSLNLSMKWNETATATGYKLIISTDTGFTNIILNDSTITDTIKAVSGLANATKYYWKVKAKNQTGWGNFSSVWNFTTMLPIPSAPILTSPVNNTTGESITPSLIWEGVTSATSYNLAISVDSNFTTTSWDTSGVIGTSLTVPTGKLTGLTKYYWRVNATNTSGTGSWSTKWNFTTSQNLPVNLKVYLEGFWNGTTHIQDTVRVYLANSTSPYIAVDSAQVELSTAGTAAINFTKAPNGNYYIIVKHRNHLETWSKLPQAMVTNITKSYDFTTASTQAYGDNMKQTGSEWVLFAGDANQDGAVDGFDVLIFVGEYGGTGYYRCDFNGDEAVDGFDVLIFVSDFGLTKAVPSLKATERSAERRQEMINEMKIKLEKEIGKENKESNEKLNKK
mgnify:CR=1 FL=1